MSVVAISSKGIATEIPSAHFEQLAVVLSGRLSRVSIEASGHVIEEALEQLAAAVCVDTCRLVEFPSPGTPANTQASPHSASAAERRDPATLPEQWLVERLARGEIVAISGPDELPPERSRAASERA